MINVSDKHIRPWFGELKPRRSMALNLHTKTRGRCWDQRVEALMKEFKIDAAASSFLVKETDPAGSHLRHHLVGNRDLVEVALAACRTVRARIRRIPAEDVVFDPFYLVGN